MAIGVKSNRVVLENYKKPYFINRLVLIGNGFDLAHGFRTSYSDFIFNYFKNALEIFERNRSYVDELFEIKYLDSFSYYSNEKTEILTFKDVRKIIKNFNSRSSLLSVNVTFHSKFLEIVFNNLSELNWVDIENIYFQSLIKVKNNSIEVKKLNDEFRLIETNLIEYLKSLLLDDQLYLSASYSKLFAEKVRKEDIVTINLDEDLIPKTLYFLNFNYTSTILNYIDSIDNKDVDIKLNFIHGKLGDENNPIIFGFGDELDENYSDFENLKNNELFTNIKSFKYSQTKNYHDLIRFLESDDFQVYILGHSCGLSDRTMLNEIFEHINCKSIKAFYHQRQDGTDDFTEKTYEISKHFEEKGLMRKKLIPKNESCEMPKPIWAE